MWGTTISFCILEVLEEMTHFQFFKTHPRTDFILSFIRPHRSTTGVAYCLRLSNVVCLSVCHDREPYKSGWADPDAVRNVDLGGPKEPCLRWGFRSPHVKWQFWGRNMAGPGYIRTCPTVDILKASQQGAASVRWGCRLGCTRYNNNNELITRNVGQCPTWWPPCRIQVAPSVQRRSLAVQ